jgi:hypothetical protein
MSNLSDGGRIGSTVPSAITARGTLPCENDRAKPDRISRLARSTNLSKILEGGPPKRYPLDRGPDLRPAQAHAWVVLELGAHRRIFSACIADFGVFARTFQTYQSPGCGSRNDSARTTVDNSARAAQKFKHRPAKIARATRARGRSTPGSCNGLFSVGFPTGVQRCTTCAIRPTLRTSFPLPPKTNLDGAGLFGHREAPLLTSNLTRVAQPTPQCKRGKGATFPRLAIGPRIAISRG